LGNFPQKSPKKPRGWLFIYFKLKIYLKNNLKRKKNLANTLGSWLGTVAESLLLNSKPNQGWAKKDRS